MMDQYKEQYKKETEQIHAPADLIARTKAAVREEEARMQRERAAQQAGLAGQQALTAQKKRNYGASARKWAYPLTAVAAIVVLASVSLMMRGMSKSTSESATDTAAEGAESGADYASEAPAETTYDEAAVMEESAEASEEEFASTEESVEEAFAPEMAAGAAYDEAAVPQADAGSATSAADTAGQEDETKREAVSEDLSSEKGSVENATLQKKEMEETLADSKGAAVTIEKVLKKPAFVNRTDVESRTYEEMVFWIIEEKSGWTAYVEGENGGGYVIRGEAETVEAFLEAGYEKLEELN